MAVRMRLVTHRIGEAPFGSTSTISPSLGFVTTPMSPGPPRCTPNPRPLRLQPRSALTAAPAHLFACTCATMRMCNYSHVQLCACATICMLMRNYAHVQLCACATIRNVQCAYSRASITHTYSHALFTRTIPYAPVRMHQSHAGACGVACPMHMPYMHMPDAHAGACGHSL